MAEGPETSLTWEQLADDPYPALNDLRTTAPVAYGTRLGRWLVTSRRLVLDVLLDTEGFTTSHPASPVQRTLGYQMLSTDGADQIRHRRPFAPSFRLRSLAEDVAPLVRARAASLLAEFEADGGPINPVTAQLAVGTVVDVLGLLVDDLHQVRSWYDDLAAALADKNVGGPAAADAVRSVREAVGSTLQGAPSGALASLGVAAHAGLTTEEIGSNVLLILFGGIETTESMMLNALWCIAHHDIDQVRLVDHPELLANTIEESLRWEPAVQTLTRFAVTDTEINGVPVRQGQAIECMVAGANRDPDYFHTPDAFQADRPNAKDHVTFGFGRHLCLGLHLARLETTILLQELFGRLGQVDIDYEQSLRPHGHEFRRSSHLVTR